ncbi:MAG: carboxylesterase family protein, partial [Myxococcota bacterium]
VAIAMLPGFWFDGETRPIPIADVSSERLTTLGTVVGFESQAGGHAWLGIPYAAAPVGRLRWRAPQRPRPWSEPLDALDYGSPCVQLANPYGGVAADEEGALVGDEDCLTLNVWAPHFDPDRVPSGDDRLPVMVWIHGGGNTIGQADAFYDGALLAMRHRVLVVSLNYRLGPFGWFAHPALQQDLGPDEIASGNFGLLDLVAGLRWVKANIEFFGGDPDNVTIFGESAGGTNVIALMLSPEAGGLFHGAIAQSGSTRSSSLNNAIDYTDGDPGGDPFSAREVVLRLLVADGSASDRSSAKAFAEGLDAAQTSEFLRARAPEEVMSAYLEEPDSTRISLPRVFGDGTLLPEGDWLDALETPGPVNRVPVILGSNRDEMKLYYSLDPDFVGWRLGIFPYLRDAERFTFMAALESNHWKLMGVDAPARRLVAGGAGPVYAYRFDWDEEPTYFGADIGEILGAGHGVEIPFVFGHFRFSTEWISDLIFNEQNLPGRRFVSEAMMSYWAEFAYSGSPGRGRGGDLPEWKPWEAPAAGGGQFMVFDTPAEGGLHMSRDTVSREELIAVVDATPEHSQQEKCEIFYDIFGRDADFNEDVYRQLGEQGCAAYPMELFATP